MTDTPITLVEDAAVLDAVANGVAVADRTGWGLIRIPGGTRQNFLHNQTTNDFKRLQPGHVLDTVWLTSTARVIDVVTVLATNHEYWMLTSPERRETLLGWMPRFVFFMDDVKFHDETSNYTILSLYGPQSEAVLTSLGGAPIPQGQHETATLAGIENVRVIANSGLGVVGYTLIVPNDAANTLWNTLTETGALPMSANQWEMLRVMQGRPAADKELTEDYNPLEVGLWDAVSFAKGCYIGQEIVARLDTYQKLKQQLWGLRLSNSVDTGTPITLDGQEVGVVTSVTATPNGPFALGFVRVKAGGEGLTVQVGDATADVVDLPFITRGRRDL